MTADWITQEISINLEKALIEDTNRFIIAIQVSGKSFLYEY